MAAVSPGLADQAMRKCGGLPGDFWVDWLLFCGISRASEVYIFEQDIFLRLTGTQMKHFSILFVSVFFLPFALLSGCGIGGGNIVTVQPNVAIKGSMHGGQQPVSGATIQLYAVGATDGGGATPLLKSTVTTDASGGFNITSNFDCPSGDPLVYLVGTGGDPGVGQTNSAIGLMAALGRCSSLSASTFVQMNEVTTVAAAAALAPYMTAPANVGAADASA